MKIPQIEIIDPRLIIIKRDERQRTKPDINDLIPTIRARGILNPIIVDDENVLVAGERRTMTALHLSFAEVPIRRFSDLTELERQVIELEENVHRTELPWQDEAKAIVRIHKLYVAINDAIEWTVDTTAQAIGLSTKHVYKMLDLGEAILEGDTSVQTADSVSAAATILARKRSRQTDSALAAIMEGTHIPAPSAAQSASDGNGSSGTGGGSSSTHAPDAGSAREGDDGNLEDDGGEAENADPVLHSIGKVSPPYAILCADTREYLGAYAGPKFNFLHADLPYGVALNGQANQATFEAGGYDSNPDIYWELCRALRDNWGNIMSPSAHVMFWISMKFYTETVDFFSKAADDPKCPIPADFKINPTPLVWHKTDGKGIISDALRGPRNIYEAALIMSTGDRRIVKPVANVYGCPTAKSTDAIHPNEKPEPMLRHFMSMFVDNFSRVLDPTCGSGTSIRTAEALGAEAALGLEFNEEFAERAAAKLERARKLKNFSEQIANLGTSPLDSDED